MVTCLPSAFATIYEVCYNHFFRARNEKDGGDLGRLPGLHLPGHLRPCIRRRSPDRRAAGQLPSGSGWQGYPFLPHPKLMPEFWQFPTVSMGSGPIAAIYQARFLKYLDRPWHQGLLRADRLRLPG
ncbi:hypothetical protein ACLK2G_00615 [Escherichia coli]